MQHLHVPHIRFAPLRTLWRHPSCRLPGWDEVLDVTVSQLDFSLHSPTGAWGGGTPHANLPPRSWLPVEPNLQHIVTLHADFWKERSTSKYQKLQLFQNPKPHIWKRSLQCHDVVIYRYWHRKNKEKGVGGGREAQGVMSCQDVTRHRRNVCHPRKQGRRCVAAVILESRGCFQRRLQQHGPCGQQPKARCEVSGKSFPHRLA